MTLVELLNMPLVTSRREQVLVALYYDTVIGSTPGMTAEQVKSALISARVTGSRNANVADVLNKSGALVDFTSPSGAARLWRLTDPGIEKVRQLVGLPETHVERKHDIQALSDLVRTIADEEVRKYFEEGLIALRSGALRASIVFVWSGVVRTIREKTLAKGSVLLNAALKKHFQACRVVKSIDDFAYVPDSLLILAAQELQLVDKSQRTMLEHGLDLRNHSGHPAKYNPGPKKVSSFIEDMLSTVFDIRAC